MECYIYIHGVFSLAKKGGYGIFFSYLEGHINLSLMDIVGMVQICHKAL